MLDRARELLESQRRYYDLRASDYMGAKTDRRCAGEMEPELARELVDECGLTGDVLELACGPGTFTRDLLRHATTVTALDASAAMLARAQREVADRRVTWIQADVFSWVPMRRYDAVFFGFWLSHVPPGDLHRFSALLRECLHAGGRMAFVDEDDRGAVNDDCELVDGVPTARRTLKDGRQFDIVKVFWEPVALEARLRGLGWDVAVKPAGATFLYGVGGPTRPRGLGRRQPAGGPRTG